MPSFTPDQISRHDLDWQILRDGGIALYMQSDPLQVDLSWLRSHGYKIEELECSSWHSEQAMHEALASALHFPSYYGRNLNALNDCLCDDLGISPSTGLAVVFHHFDRFAKVSQSAHSVVHTFAAASRHHMLLGERLLLLLQCNDPNSSFRGLAPVDASWNAKEWLLRDRGV